MLRLDKGEVVIIAGLGFYCSQQGITSLRSQSGNAVSGCLDPRWFLRKASQNQKGTSQRKGPCMAGGIWLRPWQTTNRLRKAANIVLSKHVGGSNTDPEIQQSLCCGRPEKVPLIWGNPSPHVIPDAMSFSMFVSI